MSRSRSRQRHTKRYRSHTKRRRSHSFEDEDRFSLRKKRFVGKSDNNNNYYNNYNNYYYHQYNDSHNHNHNHSHNHNHYHHHYHHHHYEEEEEERKKNERKNERKNKNKNKRKRKREREISIFDDDNNDNDNDNDNDLEGSVNLKSITSIYKNRYSIGNKLGRGTFGLVIECIDNKRKIRVAVKIVRSVRRYLEAAEIEVDILNKLDALDINKNSLIIRLYKSFRCAINGIEHSCLIFEKCGHSLYDYIRANKYLGFAVNIIAMIGYQLFHSISFCHLHKLTHTDLKLENILFVSDKSEYQPRYGLYLPTNSFEIRLIDFGGATFEYDHHSSIINTRQYRGPEVISGNSWSYPSDIWSIGCILSELFCGELLFATHNDIEHLHLMHKILNSSSSAAALPPLKNEKSIKYIEKNKKLKQIINDSKLFDLINKCLQIDPNKRITALHAKNHPFFLQFRNNNIGNIEFNKIYNMINKHV